MPIFNLIDVQINIKEEYNQSISNEGVSEKKKAQFTIMDILHVCGYGLGYVRAHNMRTHPHTCT